MRQSQIKRERGAIEVEATFILPVAILCVILLLYLSLFMFQKANLQSGLETTLIYFKNTITDSYVTRNESLVMTQEDNVYKGSGNSYAISGVLNPYTGLLGDPYDIGSVDKFEKYFYSIAGTMLLNKDVTFTLNYSNYIVFKEIEVTASQKVKLPMDFSFFRIPNEIDITATARAAVIDHDDLVRNVDYAIDIVEETQIGDWARNIAEKVSEAYAKMKEMLGMT